MAHAADPQDLRLLHLPNELLVLVLLPLHPSDLITCSRVCRLLWAACERDEVWQAHAQRVGAAPGDLFIMLPYKRRYRILSRALNAARCPPPEEEVPRDVEDDLDEARRGMVDWLLYLLKSGV